MARAAVEVRRSRHVEWDVDSDGQRWNVVRYVHRKLRTLLHRYQTTGQVNKPIPLNPLESRGNYSATSNNMKFVYWPLTGGLLHLVQRGGDDLTLLCATLSRKSPRFHLHLSRSILALRLALLAARLRCRRELWPMTSIVVWPARTVEV